MNIVIAGGTGFIGKAIVNTFAKEGNHVYVLTRQKHADMENITFIPWLSAASHPENKLRHRSIDAMINLAGDPINQGRWTKRKKEAILQSRIRATQEMIRIVGHVEQKPKAFINASAIGYYGYANEQTFTETSPSLGNSFPSRVCQRWEEEAKKMEAFHIRTIIARIGVVMGNNGGALAKMILPYRFFVGGTVGTGRQWISWIHMEDLIGLIRLIIENEEINGPINLTAPHPVTMRELGQAIGTTLNRPHWFPVPEWLMKLVFGEMSGFLLKGQKVLPEKALQHQYPFRFSRIEAALSNLKTPPSP
ncbi:TIGR01777 family oxidoreductase [Desmospora activa]|uniref:TIGR01777 family protein n=1 Tax=Desmospora activa DSM 45169 TaxID=1121389 RepID=A0A2T4Z7X0_9BACL|nr:TIGR01777 family oxidoreductase [Desmospora activa]PTM57981.1 hypothetical protein C8J48_0552 [Desmospora activa DSM 45169]